MNKVEKEATKKTLEAQKSLEEKIEKYKNEQEYLKILKHLLTQTDTSKNISTQTGLPNISARLGILKKDSLIKKKNKKWMITNKGKKILQNIPKLSNEEKINKVEKSISDKLDFHELDEAISGDT